ncbi:MAG: glycosyltransferase family 1 protein [Bacteroidota bacterium]|jgi:glycosyltransferase involved in cell wall biosynthesis
MTDKPIYINGRFLAQRMTGIPRFAFEMCKAMHDQGFSFIVLAPANVLSEYVIDFKLIRFGFIKGLFWEHLLLPLYLLFHGNPLLLNFGSYGPLFYKNRIITIHDLALLVNPSWFSRSYYWYYKLVTPVAVRRSLKIITVSNFSKSEIIRLLHVPAEKIEVIYNAVALKQTAGTGIDPSSPEETLSHINSLKNTRFNGFIQKKYILSISSLDPRKNLARIVDAFLKSGLTEEYQLVFAGKTDAIFNMELSAEIVKRSLGYVTDEELVLLYKNASLFVYPSIYEGFGIPPLEAMALGCPVILSDIPVFHEVFGEACSYFDPNDTDDIINGMIKVLNDTEYRRQLTEAAFIRLRNFSWNKSANLLIDILRKTTRN